MVENNDPKKVLEMYKLIEAHRYSESCLPIYDFLIEVQNELLRNAKKDVKIIINEEDIFNQCKRASFADSNYFGISVVITNNIIVPLFIADAILKCEEEDVIECEYSSNPNLQDINNAIEIAWHFIRNNYAFKDFSTKEKTLDLVQSFFFLDTVTEDNYDAFKRCLEDWIQRVESYEKKNDKVWKVEEYFRDGNRQKLVIEIRESERLLEKLLFTIAKGEKFIRGCLIDIAEEWEAQRSSHNLKKVDERRVLYARAQVSLWPDESLKDKKFISTLRNMQMVDDYRDRKLTINIEKATNELLKIDRNKKNYGPGNKKQKKFVLTIEHKKLIEKAIPEILVILDKFYPVKDSTYEAEAKKFSANCMVLKSSDMNFVWKSVRDDKGKVDLAKRILEKYIKRITNEDITQDSLQKYLSGKLRHQV
ncbi:MAG: hypothetical protein CVU71_07070 [Deltaproteobacteria bacterium HGW-Deltaproteobacteria-6]|jgi:hypothetical protein|nr:MAG: hypothetical protein CVU71_07070 [Deltaproteobacteria bacterium HGW-Deltaproteobacteria-6]